MAWDKNYYRVLSLVLATPLMIFAQADVVPGPKLLPINKEEPKEKSSLDSLKENRKQLSKERDLGATDSDAIDEASIERKALKLKLDELLKKLAERPGLPPTNPDRKNEPPMPKVEPKKVDDPKEEVKPTEKKVAVDSLSLALNLFRDSKLNEALLAFKDIEISTYNLEDRAFIQYMMGCCYRKLNRFQEAAAQFREVADARASEMLTESAMWQLTTIKWRQDLEKQLSDVKAKRELMTPK